MRSQKQRNKAPRPFKIKNKDLQWSGGRAGSGFVLPGASLVKAAKTSGDAEAKSTAEEQAQASPPPSEPVTE